MAAPTPSANAVDGPPHLSLSPAEQALVEQHTPLRFHAYTPTTASSSAPSPPPILEAYLPLTSPSPSTLPLILTPPRASDGPALVATLNDPRVAPQLVGPPYPYTAQHAAEFLALRKRQSDAALALLVGRARAATQEADGDARWRVEGSPACVIRRADTGEFLGDFGVERWRFEDRPEGEERERATRENDAKAVGDPSVLWTFGFYLRPQYHGQGIMAHVLRTVLHSYIFPYLGADEVRGAAFASNLGSVRTQEKCGFRRYMSYEREIAESRGGGTKEVALFKLRRDDFQA